MTMDASYGIQRPPNFHSSSGGGADHQYVDQGVYELSGKGAIASPQHIVDAIPASRGTGRNGKASAHLQDADLPSKLGNYSVFGNAAFEADGVRDGGMHLMQQQPAAAVKLMNNLFDDPANVMRQRQQQQLSETRPPSASMQQQQQPDSATRLGSFTKMFRRGQAAERQAYDTGQDAGTLVQAFDDEEAAAQVADAARARQSAVSVNPYARTTQAWEQEVKHLIANKMREEAISLTAPTSGLVRCSVKRVKAFFGGTTFQMHLDSNDMFLLAARKRKKSKVSSYILSQDSEDLKRDTDNCLAKLKANFVGTEYMLWGRSDDRAVRKGYASEKLCINFKQTALSTAGPRAMYVVLPEPESGWRPSDADGADSLSTSLELARHRELPPALESKMAMLCTKAPEYDDSVKGFTLDFQGRVKEASVKNFQLVAWDHNTDHKGADLLMQFGKVDADTYALDFTYPMTIELAFAVALASIDTKLCYTM